MTENSNEQIYCTVKQIAEDPSFCFTMSMLRFYIFHADKNGLEVAIRRIGRKVLIRRDLFIAWVESHANRGAK